MPLDRDDVAPHAAAMPLSHALKAVTEGWTQKRLEEATGITQDRLSRIMSGARNNRPTLEEIRLVEAAVNKPAGFVLTLAGYATIEGVDQATRWFEDHVFIAATQNEQRLRNELDVVRILDGGKKASRKAGKKAGSDDLPLAANTGNERARKGRVRKEEPPAEQEDV